MSSIFNKLKHFDAYPKTLEDFRVKTVAGACISVVCTISIIFLFIMEWRAYTTIDVEQELFVDLTRNQRLSINLNMTLSRLPCDLLSVDASDVSGQSTHDMSKGMKKIKIDRSGRQINDAPKTTAVPETTTSELANSTKCLSCYGAEDPLHGISCCNTCQEVKFAYLRKQWQFIPHNVKQCEHEFGSENMQAKLSNREDVEKLLNTEEGCRLEGYIAVNKIAGNIHLAPGISFEQNHQHYHSMDNLPVDKLNTDHYFDIFSFGDEYPNQFNPLEVKSLKGDLPGPESNKGVPKDDIFVQLLQFGFFGDPQAEVQTNSKAVNYRYFLKIVPTTYEYLDGRIVNNTYQYSVTRSAKVLTQQSFGAAQLPGVFITYELSPIMIRYVEKSKAFSHFITSCCAIIGGLFTVAGMLDGFTFRYYNMYKKYQMNKLT